MTLRPVPFRVKLVAAALVVIVVLGVGFVLQPKTPGSITKAAAGVNFPLYYPAHLPEGYALEQSSVSGTPDVVIFSAFNRATGNRLVVSEQARPTGFDFENFYHEQTSAYKHFAAPVGDGVTGTAGDSYLGSIVTDHTWIIIKGSSTAGEQVKDFALKLKAL